MNSIADYRPVLTAVLNRPDHNVGQDGAQLPTNFTTAIFDPPHWFEITFYDITRSCLFSSIRFP